MYLIPLSQPESVELVIHALRVAGGEADCNSCPVRKVCMKQCLTIADRGGEDGCRRDPPQRRCAAGASARAFQRRPKTGAQGSQVAGFASAFSAVYGVDRAGEKV